MTGAAVVSNETASPLMMFVAGPVLEGRRNPFVAREGVPFLVLAATGFVLALRFLDIAEQIETVIGWDQTPRSPWLNVDREPANQTGSVG